MDTWFNHLRYGLLNSQLDEAAVPMPRLGELLESISSGATPKLSDSSLYAESGIKFLRILNVVDGEILDKELKYITDDVHEGQLKRSQLAEDDVLMTITGRVGSSAVVGDEHLPANINQHLVRMRIDTELCRPEFLSEWLNTGIGLELSNRFISGGTRAALDYDAIRKIRVPLPSSLEIQDTLLSVMDAARAERYAKLAEAEDLLVGIGDFVLDALEITPLAAKDSRQVYAVQSGDMDTLSLSPQFYAPELRQFLNELRNSPSVSKPISAYVEINPRANTSGISDDDIVGFIPMESVADRATGEYTAVPRPLTEVRKGFTPFRNGDILWAKITPCMQNGKICMVNALPNGMGYGSTEFHVIRVRSKDMSTEFVKEFLSQVTLRRLATFAFTGTAGQQRIPSDFLGSLPFPALSLEQQDEIVVSIKSVREEARRLRSEAEAGWEEAKRWFERQLLAE